ncbi:DUF1800 domain-containing protein, partial [Paraburkholderia sp. BR14261]
MESLSNARAGAIAMNRYGHGARAPETPPANPRGWQLGQCQAYEPLPAAWRNEPGALALAARFGEERQQGMAGNAAASAASETNAQGNAQQAARRAVNQAIRRESVGIYRSAVNARLTSALQSDTPFVERLVHFWSNHFAVSVDKALIAGIAGAFEMEAIRPHVLGNFADMLVAVEQHPAMQLFLDQTRSVGPDSRAALRADQRDPAHKRGLNENLAREIMELHTLGVRTGYTQDDVTEFARALTGRSVAGLRGPQPGNAAPGSFVFRPALHEPGTRTVMGKRYDQLGEQQALAILNDLAHASATSRHIAFQLARHFVADNPPPALTERLALAFEQSGGDLPTVYRALVEAPQAWAPVDAKFKT